jgi:hypothetical protein
MINSISNIDSFKTPNKQKVEETKKWEQRAKGFILATIASFICNLDIKPAGITNNLHKVVNHPTPQSTLQNTQSAKGGIDMYWEYILTTYKRFNNTSDKPKDTDIKELFKQIVLQNNPHYNNNTNKVDIIYDKYEEIFTTIKAQDSSQGIPESNLKRQAFVTALFEYAKTHVKPDHPTLGKLSELLTENFVMDTAGSIFGANQEGIQRFFPGSENVTATPSKTSKNQNKLPQNRPSTTNSRPSSTLPNNSTKTQKAENAKTNYADYYQNLASFNWKNFETQEYKALIEKIKWWTDKGLLDGNNHKVPVKYPNHYKMVSINKLPIAIANAVAFGSKTNFEANIKEITRNISLEIDKIVLKNIRVDYNNQLEIPDNQMYAYYVEYPYGVGEKAGSGTGTLQKNADIPVNTASVIKIMPVLALKDLPLDSYIDGESVERLTQRALGEQSSNTAYNELLRKVKEAFNNPYIRQLPFLSVPYRQAPYRWPSLETLAYYMKQITNTKDSPVLDFANKVMVENKDPLCVPFDGACKPGSNSLGTSVVAQFSSDPNNPKAGSTYIVANMKNPYANQNRNDESFKKQIEEYIIHYGFGNDAYLISNSPDLNLAPELIDQITKILKESKSPYETYKCIMKLTLKAPPNLQISPNSSQAELLADIYRLLSFAPNS